MEFKQVRKYRAMLATVDLQVNMVTAEVMLRLANNTLKDENPSIDEILSMVDVVNQKHIQSDTQQIKNG